MASAITFNTSDALIFYAIAYCQRHGETATLGRIFLTTDAINRSYSSRQELEDGLNKLLASGYIKRQSYEYVATSVGVQLFDDVTNTSQKLKVFDQLIKLNNMLQNKSNNVNASARITITNEDVAAAIKESYVIFGELKK